ncbi:MAG: ABC transporter substrate-binding protein [archaeon]
MKNKNKLLIYGIIIIVIILAIFLLGAKTGLIILKKQNETIKIGAIMPLTGSIADFGIDTKMALTTAIEEINNKKVLGKNIEIIYEDGRCDGKEALTAAQKLINIDNVDIIIGGVCSTETLGMSEYVNSSKKILISPVSTSPEITSAGDYIFRTAPSDTSQGKIIADTMIKKNQKNISIIYAKNDAYSKGIRDTFIEKYKGIGGTIVSEESYNYNLGQDTKTQIEKVLSKNPQALLIISSSPQTFDLILKRLAEIDYKDQIYTVDALMTEDVIKNNKILEGSIFGRPKFDDNKEDIVNFLSKIKNEKNYSPKALPPFYFASIYDLANIVKEGIEKCNGTTPDCIKDYLYSIKNRNGMLGNLTIDPNGDAVLEFELKIIRDGKIENIN